MNIRFSRQSENDLEAIGDWIAKDDPKAVSRFVFALREECNVLAMFPARHPVFVQTATETVHRKVFDQYLIFYTISKTSIDILRIIHGAQDYKRFF